MNDAARREGEAAFRADAARLVQVVRGYLQTGDFPADAAPMAGHVRHLAQLLEADAPTEHLQEAALAVVDSYDWPSPDVSGSGEGPVIAAPILAAVERLRDAIDVIDTLDDDG